MKTKKLNPVLMGMYFFLLTLMVACSSSDDTPEPEPEPNAPTIALNQPTDLTDLRVLVGSPLTFSFTVNAEAGLSSVSLNGESIKNYDGTSTADTFTYDFTALENGSNSLVFVVEDALGKTTSLSAVAIEAVGDIGFLLADFGGDFVSSTIEVRAWETDRSINVFNITNALAPETTTVETVGKQSEYVYGADNPDTEAPIEFQGKAMAISKIAEPNWGGWDHNIFNLGEAIPSEMINALPQVADPVDGGLTTDNTKVVQIDAYYDDTVDDDWSFSDIAAIDGDAPQGADKTAGYQVELTLINYAQHSVNWDGAGFYINYRAHITEPNKWVTLTFELLDNSRLGSFYGVNEEAPGPDQVDGFKIVGNAGYTGMDQNPVYFRNLRIVDAQ
ncbi:hypothetical protein [Maribacter sp. 2304DJ31-5]|uniref:hypothetical protein n=1 Tax=Maribacter sp. 2304DJ31-5 TaxID=3386273 RepID=UPI0039BD714C